MRVAVLGTGIMGGSMARNIAAAGHDVVVWNRSRGKADATGLAVAETPADAVAGAEILVTVLRDFDAVAEALDGVELGDLPWLQCSTVGQRIDELARLDTQLVDAPVLGSRKAAADGALTVYLAGPAGAREAVRPVAETMGTVVDVGDRVGDATRLKLILNTWVVLLTESTAELLALAEAAGLEPQLVLDTLAGAPMDSPYLQLKGSLIVNRTFEPQFKLETALKDVELIEELAARSGVVLPLV